jgi:hypothetical protein
MATLELSLPHVGEPPHDIAEYPIDRSKSGFAMLSEANPGDRISGTTQPDTSLGGGVGDLGDLAPGQRKENKGNKTVPQQKRRAKQTLCITSMKA